MIPQHIIDKAVTAAGENWALNFEWEHDKLHAQVHAALEAVAADIWDSGYEAGKEDTFYRAFGHKPIPNPYRASETA